MGGRTQRTRKAAHSFEGSSQLRDLQDLMRERLKFKGGTAWGCGRVGGREKHRDPALT